MSTEEGKLVFETNRLVLREATLENAPLFYELNNDPQVIQYTGDPPFASIQKAREFLSSYIPCYDRYGMGRWTVTTKKDERVLGWCGLKWHPEDGAVDVGFRLMRKYWNQGYATEAASGCLMYGFEALGLEKIIGSAQRENTASIRVLEKMGMTRKFEYEEDGFSWLRYEITQKENTENWL